MIPARAGRAGLLCINSLNVVAVKQYTELLQLWEREERMGEFSIFHWLIVLVFFGGFWVGIPWLAYRHGKKVGDQAGYIRGYKGGQQSQQGVKKVTDAGTF